MLNLGVSFDFEPLEMNILITLILYRDRTNGEILAVNDDNEIVFETLIPHESASFIV